MTIATHPDYLALLRNVLHAPDDDLPRLVLAGWLEEPERAGSVRCEDCDGEPVCEMCDGNNTVEHYSGSGGGLNCPNGYKDDDKPSYFVGCKPKCHTCKGTGYFSNVNAERAEFIRLQIEIAKKPQCNTSVGYPDNYICDRAESWGCRRCLAMKREKKMLLAHCLNWVPRTSDGKSTIAEVILSDKWTFNGRMAVQFNRGFVGSIRLTAEQFMQHAAELFREHPITEVVLSDVQIEYTETRFGNYWFLPARRIPGFLRAEKEFSELNDDNGTFAYTGPNEHIAALSRACVRYGRRLAGLKEEYPK